jgi:hypothetical protein
VRIFSMRSARKALSTTCATSVRLCTAVTPLRIASAKLRAKRAMVALVMILPAIGMRNLMRSQS